MKAYGYIRVSTEGQATDGVSLDAQRAKVSAWADLNGYELAGIFEDAGISGTKADRPGLAAALAAVRKTCPDAAERGPKSPARLQGLKRSGSGFGIR